ncbi:MAG: ChaN family lipoprotein [Deltaproteobacteria bacterium]|nr:ChaN family lipoprotein [Deltaproteobacteria bacterium]
MTHRIPVFASMLLAGALAACGGTYARGTAPVRGVAAAGLPYEILDAHTGRQVDKAAFWTAIGGARAVCIGEEHPNPHHHWMQLEVVSHLAALPRPFAVGMEMVQRPFQGVLDDYAAGRIDAAALESRTGWADRWGYDFAMYQPILAEAVAHHATLLALNASKELVKKVSHEGIDKLDAADRALLPEMKLDDAKHRAWFEAIMARMGASPHGHRVGHGAGKEMPHDAIHAGVPEGAGGPADGHGAGKAMPHDAVHEGVMPHDANHAGVSDGDDDGDEDGDEADDAPPTAEELAAQDAAAERMYSVQVLWDESMADGAARWLAGDPTRAIAILAGDGHCHDSAIVGRIKRRGIASVVSLRPVVDDGEGAVATVLASPENDYVIVLTPPKQ